MTTIFNKPWTSQVKCDSSAEELSGASVDQEVERSSTKVKVRISIPGPWSLHAGMSSGKERPEQPSGAIQVSVSCKCSREWAGGTLHGKPLPPVYEWMNAGSVLQSALSGWSDWTSCINAVSLPFKSSSRGQRRGISSDMSVTAWQKGLNAAVTTDKEFDFRWWSH